MSFDLTPRTVPELQCSGKSKSGPAAGQKHDRSELTEPNHGHKGGSAQHPLAAADVAIGVAQPWPPRGRPGSGVLGGLQKKQQQLLEQPAA